MRAVPALFDNGQITFSFVLPEYQGPLSVLVIFPDCDHFDTMESHEDGPDDCLPPMSAEARVHLEELIDLPAVRKTMEV